MADVQIVGCAITEEEALSGFGSRTDGCDVAIIDIFLQSGSGLGVLDAMRAFAPPPQRVVLKNYSTRDMRARCKELGAEEVFDKSTEVEELMLWFRNSKQPDLTHLAGATPTRGPTDGRPWLLALAW